MTRVEIDAAIQKYAEQETLYDQPQIDKSKARVTGPFTVEAVPAVTVRPLEMATENVPMQLDPQAALPGVGAQTPGRIADDGRCFGRPLRRDGAAAGMARRIAGVRRARQERPAD